MTFSDKDLYKRFLVMIMSVLVVVISFSSVVNADFGPKPSCEVTVVNAPADEYYIALLTNGWSRHDEYSYKDYLSDRENEVIQFINDYEDEEGYRLFCNFNVLFFRSNETHKYRFYDQSFPGTYKIMIVTLDGTVKVSPAVTQKAFSAKMIYDFASNTIQEKYIGVYTNCIPWVFVFAFITLLNEGLILLAFNLFRKKNILPFLTINIITQIILNTANIIWYISGNIDHYPGVWVAIEIVITAIEAVWYSKKLIRKDGSVSVRRNILYAITANLVSALTDMPVLIILMLFPFFRESL
ncbi:MAG: hypothetical protein IKH20_09565 [Clostridiales bacterium]|nr:hypothetical protein [Clostridiales bacterium]